MIADAFVIRLPDGTLHFARPGHVSALCGANRVTNGDRWTGTVDAICPACSLLRGGPRAIPEIEEEMDGVREALYDRPRIVDPAIRSRLGRRRKELSDELAEAKRLGYESRVVECPDCGHLWPIDRGEPCPNCGLAEEDVEAAADFWVALGSGEL